MLINKTFLNIIIIQLRIYFTLNIIESIDHDITLWTKVKHDMDISKQTGLIQTRINRNMYKIYYSIYIY